MPETSDQKGLNLLGPHLAEILFVRDGVDGDVPAKIFLVKFAVNMDLIHIDPAVLVFRCKAGNDRVHLRFFEVFQGQIRAADRERLFPHGDLRILLRRFVAEKHIWHRGDHKHGYHDDGNENADGKLDDRWQELLRSGGSRAVKPSCDRRPHDVDSCLDHARRIRHDLRSGAAVPVIHPMSPPACSPAGASSSSARLHADRDATEWIPGFCRSAEQTAS